MPIDSLATFASTLKLTNNSMINSYSNIEKSPTLMSESDFDSLNQIIKGLDMTSKMATVGVLKKAYDLVKCHHRAFRIHNMSRDDYYQAAIIDKAKDNIILDKLVTSLDAQFDKYSAIEQAGLDNGN